MRCALTPAALLLPLPLLPQHQVLGKFYHGWKDEVQDEKRLKKLVMEFFKLCIKRMRLSPQACMAFFNPGEWSDAVAASDMLKIRRMMLQKLFTGWRMEARELKNMRYKAAQILARMMRRTRGPLWVKESSLVCFHMWHRYVSVKVRCPCCCLFRQDRH